MSFGKQDTPIAKLFDSFLTHSQVSIPPRLPLVCFCHTSQPLKPNMKYSFFSKFIKRHHRYHVFPTAKCESENYQNETAHGGHKPDGDLRLPGLRMKKRRDATTKTVGEFEINQIMVTESGWDRVKYMYRMKSGGFEDEGLQVLNTMFYRTVIIGFFVSAMMESMKRDKAERSLSKTDAMRKGLASQVVVPKEVLKSALKDTFKLSILSLSLLHLSQTISAYKNKTSVWEFTLSSAIGFGSIGIAHSPYKCGMLTIGGALVGTLGGWLVCQILQSSSLTQESRSMKRIQESVEESRLQSDTDE